MMLSDLPTEILEEILNRVPVTSLKEVRATCKPWNVLLKTNRRFRQEALKKSMVLMLKDYRVYRMSINHGIASQYIELHGALTLKDPHSNLEQVDIARVFHCEGLLLCTTKDNGVVVCNPYLDETKWIINQETDYKRDFNFALGYQNNKSCRHYKILRWWNCYKPKNQVAAFEIYEFSSNSWRLLDNIHLCCFIESNTGVSLKGNTYWLASEDTVLLCFDFTVERFKHFSLPPIQSLGKTVISVVREEQLSVLHQKFHTTRMEIWMTSNIEAEAALLWKKYFTVDLNIPTIRYYLPVCTSFFIDEGKKKEMCCTISSYETSRNMVSIIGVGVDDLYYNEISDDEESLNWQRPIIFNYVPSLVQI